LQPRVLASSGLIHLVLDGMSLEVSGPGRWDAEKQHLVHEPLSPGHGLRRFRVLANSRPKRRPHSRMLLYGTTTPQAARISSTSCRLRLKQWYSHTACSIPFAGK